MALTANQQTKLNDVKTTIAKMKQDLLQDSLTGRSLFGSYLFDKFEQLDKQVKALEQA